VHANGRVRQWRIRDGRRATIRVAGNMPLEIDVAASGRCVLTAGGKRIAGTTQPAASPGGPVVTRLRLSLTDTGEADLDCR
jgi:hypothetical protein